MKKTSQYIKGIQKKRRGKKKKKTDEREVYTNTQQIYIIIYKYVCNICIVFI